MADQLATPADLASLLKRSFDEYDTASVTLAIEVCTAVVQAAADGQRILLVENDTEETWGGSSRLLRLKQRPVVSVSSVTYAGSTLSQGTASGTWRRSPHGLWRDLGWAVTCGEPSPISVVYSHGYAPGRQELQLARGTVLSLARGLFDNPRGIARAQIDDYAVAYEKASAALDASPSLRGLLRKQYGPKARMVSVL